MATVAYEALRRIRQVARAAPEATRIVVRASAQVAAFLSEEEGFAVDRLERELARRITVESNERSDLAHLDVRAI